MYYCHDLRNKLHCLYTTSAASPNTLRPLCQLQADWFPCALQSGLCSALYSYINRTNLAEHASYSPVLTLSTVLSLLSGKNSHRYFCLFSQLTGEQAKPEIKTTV